MNNFSTFETHEKVYDLDFTEQYTSIKTIIS